MRAESSAYLVFGEAPFSLALAAREVLSAVDSAAYAGRATLSLESLAGLPGEPPPGRGRVLSLSATVGVALLVAGKVAVIEVDERAVLALPKMLSRGGLFSALITEGGAPQTLVLDARELGRRARQHATLGDE